MSLIKSTKISSATAAFGVAIMLVAGSVSAASADNKSSDSKETKPACSENYRNVGTVAAPICVANGASAYEIALKKGFQGDVTAWLASLKGDQGLKGDTGALGPQGPQGPVGAPGAPGDKGLKGDPGTDGLNGHDGAPGATGPQGPQGPAGPAGAQGPAGNDGQNANVIGTACSFTYAGSDHVTHTYTGVWGFQNIKVSEHNNGAFAAFGCVVGNGGNDD